MFAQIVLPVLIMLGAASCGTTKALLVGEEQVVERSQDHRPDWTQRTFEETKEVYRFSGGAEGVLYSLAVSQAEAEALKRLSSAIELTTRREFTEWTQGANLREEDLGRFVADGVALTVNNLEIQGVKSKEVYYERFQRLVSPEEVIYQYRTFVLLQIAKGDFRAAQRWAANHLIDKSRAQQNQAAEEAAQRLLERLENEREKRTDGTPRHP